MVSEKVADRLGQPSSSSPGAHIAKNGDGVRVVADGLTVDARQVIVAVPPALAARIALLARAAQGQAKVLAALVPGQADQGEAVYDRPFWRDAGLSGQGVSDVGPAQHDVRQHAARRLGRRALRVRRRRRRTRLGAMLAGRSAPCRRCSRTSPPSSATRRATPVDYFEQDWTKERWTRGCPVAHVAPGVLTKYGPWLRRSVGKVHFAGTETADYWLGYMDGAVRSGERAAREVLAALRR